MHSCCASLSGVFPVHHPQRTLVLNLMVARDIMAADWKCSMIKCRPSDSVLYRCFWGLGGLSEVLDISINMGETTRFFCVVQLKGLFWSQSVLEKTHPFK